PPTGATGCDTGPDPLGPPTAPVPNGGADAPRPDAVVTISALSSGFLMTTRSTAPGSRTIDSRPSPTSLLMSSKTRLLPSDDSFGVLVCEQSDGGTSAHGPFSSPKNFFVALHATIVGVLGGAVPSRVNVSAPTVAPSGRSKLNAATACDVAGAPLVGSAGADPFPLEPCTNRSPAATSGGAGGAGAPLPTFAALHTAAMSG